MAHHLKHLSLWCSGVLCALFISAQPSLTKVEYYIDTDPGYGKATAVSFTPSANLSNISASINPATLSTGVHVFGMRAQDAKGAWSVDNKWLFVKDAAFVNVQNITNAEYYIDTDPGYGKATAINITPGTDLSNLSTNINPTTLSTGVHVFGIRAKDLNGAWSVDNKWLFVKDAAFVNAQNITNAEYYIDTDPGYGKATAISITPGMDLSNLSASINPATVSTGVHVFGIRAKDLNGAWSIDNKWLFVKDAAFVGVPNITNAEYYIDRDPGYGKGTAITITPGNDLANIPANLNTTTISTGVHVFAIRAKDAYGAWSLDNKLLFVKDAAAVITPNITSAEYYIDTDPGYGKATAISITPGADLSNLTANINPATLSTGVHVFGLRARDAYGAWSLDNKWLLVKDAAFVAVPNIANAEYYIDTDPGYGKATAISITPGSDLSNLSTNINPATLSAGVHVFGIRAKDINGAWSLDNKWLFVKDAAFVAVPTITNAEFYIDTDPGYGKATSITITPGSDLSNLSTIINPTSLSAGVHLFGIRAKDMYGAWSLDNKWLFVKDLPQANKPNIVRVEYYVGKDPGYGYATSINITADTNLVNLMANVGTGTFTDGSYIFSIRAKDANGAWSLDNKWFFTSMGNLPIILANFTGNYYNNGNELTAVIASAYNVKAVELERSPDGINFKYLGDMAVAPVTAGTYKYVDKNPPSGNNFYRLRTVDLDGHTEYSYIVLLNHAAAFTVHAYPNPVQDNLTVHFENMNIGTYSIKITDIQGKVIFLNKVQIVQGAQFGDINIPLGQYAAGTYLLQVADDLNRIVTTQKIIKQSK